ncbi:hypothetical protein U1Q18_016158, partial [Sarracenia purpurea var. burkii]
ARRIPLSNVIKRGVESGGELDGVRGHGNRGREGAMGRRDFVVARRGIIQTLACNGLITWNLFWCRLLKYFGRNMIPRYTKVLNLHFL